MNITIRAVKDDEETAVIALWRTCGLVVSHNDPVADFRLARGKSNSDVLVALNDDNQIIGAALVGHDGHRGWLYYVAVDPDHRLKGVGRELVQAGEKWIAERGIPKMQLMIRETNTQVADFYESVGYGKIPRT